MAATVTTPYAVPGNIIGQVTLLGSMSVTSAFIDAMHLLPLRITTSGIKHLAIPMPISRWDGTTWVKTYSPTA